MGLFISYSGAIPAGARQATSIALGVDIHLMEVELRGAPSAPPIQSQIAKLARVQRPTVSRWLAPACVASAAIGFALKNGMQYGRSNHWQYLLHGLHAADSTFLSSDWFTTRTEAHHQVFNGLVRLAASSGKPEVMLGLLNGACSLIFVCTLFFIIARFVTRPLLPFSLVVLLASGIPIDGLGDSNILLPYFVPSVFAGVVLLASFACLLYSRYSAAGLLAGAGCAMHGNFLLLIGPLWGLLLIFDGSSRTKSRVAWLLIPWVAAWFAHLGYFLAIIRDPAPSAEARRIFWDIYAPFHYRPLTWSWREYVEFAAVTLGGLIAAIQSRIVFGRTAVAIIAAVASIFAIGAIGTIGWSVDFITALYTWRLAPFLVVAALVAIALAVTESGASPIRRMGLAIAFALLLRLARMPAVPCGCIVLAGVLSILCDRVGRVPGWGRTAFQVGIGVAASLLVGATLARQGLWRRDMFRRAYRPAEESLYTWCRENTDPGAVFIIPPNLAPFRLEARRAVLIDWKCMPLLPHDQLEWRRRQERLAGRPISCEADALAGYSELDPARAELLAQDFGCKYVVVDRLTNVRRLDPLRHAYSNDRFDVFEISASRVALRR